MKKHTLLVVTLCLMLIAGSCFNADISSAKSLKQINDDIKAKQAELEKGKAKEESLSSQVSELEESVYELDNQIAAGEVKLKKLKKKLKATKKKVNAQNEDLGKRLRNMYKNGSVGFLDVIMNSGSFSEFLTNLDLVEKIYVSDKDVLQSLKDSQIKLKKQKDKVEALQEDLIEAKATAEEEKQIIVSKKEEVAADNEETAKMLDEMEAEAEQIQAELAAKAEEGKISSSTTSEYSGGAFEWPTPGYTTITSDYGWRTCPFHGREFHGAVDIGADYGSKIIAAAGGTVISSGWNGGFGYSVQVDHGGGIVTMYNHCSTLKVSEGDTVKKGQVIAYVGSTGSSTGPHLDYRIFRNGETLNPMSYY